MKLVFKKHSIVVPDYLSTKIAFVSLCGKHSYGTAIFGDDLDLYGVWVPTLWHSLSPFFKEVSTKLTHYSNSDTRVTLVPIIEYIKALADGEFETLEMLYQPKLKEDHTIVINFWTKICGNLNLSFVDSYQKNYRVYLDLFNQYTTYNYRLSALLEMYRTNLAALSVLEKSPEYNIYSLIDRNLSNNIQLIPELIEQLTNVTDQFSRQPSQYLDEIELLSEEVSVRRSHSTSKLACSTNIKSDLSDLLVDTYISRKQ